MTSKQIKTAAFIVGLLVLLNIALVATIWLQQKPDRTPRGHPDAQRILIKELSLNESQVRMFDSLRSEHFRNMADLREEMHKLKDRFFSTLGDTTGTPDSIASAIGGVQTKMERATYRHFAAVRNICNPAQKQKFDGIIQEVLRSMAPVGPGGPPGPPH
jgi:periplasmic protein CpxP/Spy